MRCSVKRKKQKQVSTRVNQECKRLKVNHNFVKKNRILDAIDSMQ